MNRTKGYIVLAAAFVMQLCLGGIYAWSVFVPHLQADFGFTPAGTGLIFGTAMCVFTVSLLFTGPLQDRYGPRPLAVCSGVLVGASYLTAGVAGPHFVLWWLAVGLLGGLAVGCGYVCPIATAVKWFPRHKGLVSGVAVAGYGGSAIVLSNLANALLARGWSVMEVFRAVGVIYGPAVVATSLLLFLPEPVRHHDEARISRRVVLADRRFWWLFVTFFCSAFAGLVVIGHLRPIGESLGHGVSTAVAAISVLAVGNAAGRIIWGFIYDRLGVRRTVMLLLTLMAVSVLAVAAAGRGRIGFMIAAAMVGFCYGGNFGIYAPESARLYGARVMGAVYPLLLLSHGLAAQIGPPVAGWLAGLTPTRRGYEAGLLLGVAVVLVGLLVYARFARAPAPRGGEI